MYFPVHRFHFEFIFILQFSQNIPFTEKGFTELDVYFGTKYSKSTIGYVSEKSQKRNMDK